MFALLYVYAEPLFSFVFGSEWAGSAPYLHALLPWMWILLVTNSLLSVPYALSKQQGEFLFSLVALVLRVAGLGIGILNKDFILAIRLFAAASSLVLIMRLVWYAVLLHRYDKLVTANR